MKIRFPCALALIANIFLNSAPMFAHHSAASYDRSKGMTLSGTVTEFLFVNPHTQISFEVRREDGTVEKWVAESGPPQRLSHLGWKADSLKPGDRITVTGFPLKDGSKEINLRRLIAPSGQILTEGAE